MKTAIVLVDLLSDYFQKTKLKEQRDNIASSVDELTTAGRKNNLPIIWIRQEIKKDLSNAPQIQKEKQLQVTIKGTKGCQVLPELEQSDSDYNLVKTRFSGFFETELENLLNKLDIDSIIIAGLTTHACVHMTAMDAYQRDYKVILAIDCIISHDDEYHKVFLRYLSDQKTKAYTNEEIKNLLRRQK